MADQIEEIKQKTDIVVIIGERVKLTRAGKHYKGLCPFHAEKTPSFTVSPELQIFKCFGCGEAGDVFTFLERYEGMEFSEALLSLAGRAGVTLEKATRGETTQKDRLREINELAAKFYHFLLTKHPLGKEALEYLLNSRGISLESINTFQLGFAPINPRSLINFLTKKKFAYQDMEKAGVAIYQKDRFRNRVIFPLSDHRGNCVGLAGRIMPNETNKNVGKYINSPETPIYHKGSLLYGLNVTRSFIKKSGVAVIVEGEVDAISSYQFGVKNVVAIKGSALTEEQLRILSRLTSTIVLALDSDVAGDSAARRGITLAQSLGMNIRIMQQDKYKDPDEFARQDPKGYKSALKNAIGIWDFIIDSVLKKHKISTGEGKASVSRELVPILAGIPDEIVRAHYAGVLAQRLEVPFEAVSQQLSKVVTPKLNTVTENPTEKIQKSRQEILEESVISLGLKSDDPSILLSDEVLPFIKGTFGQRLLEHLEEFLKKAKEWKIEEFFASLPSELKAKFEDLVLTEDMGQENEVRIAIRELGKWVLKQQMDLLTHDIARHQASGDKSKLKEAEKEFQQVTRLLSTKFPL